MKRCNICNQLYADSFEQCPNCSSTVSKEINKILMSVVILIAAAIFLIVGFIATKKDPNIISSSSMGDKYPYTVDNVRIQCAANYPNAVYIIDKNKNKYAVNGSANQYFTVIKPDKYYKGYTTKILKKGLSDAEVLQMGLKICKD